MRKKELLARVAEMAGPICGEVGVFLWDITFEKEGRNHTLTLFIDRDEGGIFIEDCERVSRAVDPMLDAPEFDGLPAYTLSVSSAGVQRRLTRPRHYQWAVGKEIEVTFYKGGDMGPRAVGRLTAFDDETLTMVINGQETTVPRARVSGARMYYEF